MVVNVDGYKVIVFVPDFVPSFFTHVTAVTGPKPMVKFKWSVDIGDALAVDRPISSSDDGPCHRAWQSASNNRRDCWVHNGATPTFTGDVL